jgi:membrane protease subunit (stomatin/prohibitin family)
MSSRLVHPLTDFLAESRYSYAEIDAHREEIAAGMNTQLQQEFLKMGFVITDFRIEGTDFDEDTLKRINRIANLSAEAQEPGD